MTSLAGSVAVVTGGASGIGRALVLAAASRGAAVAVADIEIDRAAAVADEVEVLGGRARAFRCDVSQAGELDALAEAVAGEFGGVNLLFNNAGVVVGGTLEATKAKDAEWLFAVNVMGVFNGTRAFLPLLHAAAADGKPAHIVNTGSENSLGLPVIGPNSVYTATKHALLGLTDALRRDLNGTRIGVTLLCPGVVATDVFDAGRNRPADFGGPQKVSEDHAKRVRSFMAEHGQDPALTAELCFEGMARGDFLIVTDPKIRGFSTRRSAEVEAALDWIDQRLAEPHRRHA